MMYGFMLIRAIQMVEMASRKEIDTPKIGQKLTTFEMDIS